MRFIRIRKRELIAAERPKPYISRWGTSYCIRRTKRIAGEPPRRPGIWTDSTYISTGASDSYTWTSHEIVYGNVVADIRKGGQGEIDGPPCMIFPIGSETSGIAELLLFRGELSTVRGLSLGSSAFVQGFRRLNVATREMFAGAECEICHDNARARLYGADFIPADKTHIKATLLAKSLSTSSDGDDIPEVRAWLMAATNPDLILYIK